MAQEKEYFAFISYQRKDEEWADRLRNKLEHYRLPSSVRKQDASLPKEIRPIFRDALELAGGVLAKEIETALQNSKFLIVICSPNSAKSPWVNKEIQTFIDLGCEDRIIPFIIDGTPFSDDEKTECFPPVLRSLKGEKELLGININELGRDAAFIKVVARMFDLKFDTLWQRYEREKKRKRWMMIGGVLLFAIAATVIASIFFNLNNELKNTINDRDGALHLADSALTQVRKDSVVLAEHLKRIMRDSLTLANQKDSIRLQKDEIAMERDNVKSANYQMKLNLSRVLAKEASKLVDEGDPYIASLLALQALPPNLPYTIEAERALRVSYGPNYVKFEYPRGYPHSIAYSPDGKLLAESHGNVINIRNLSTGVVLRELAGHKGTVNNANFNSDGTFVVSSSDDKTVRIWNVKTGEQIGNSFSHSSNVNFVLFSPNGNLIASASDSTLRIWDLHTNKQIGAPMTGHTNKVTSLTFSPTGDTIASASWDHTIRLWNLKTGKQIGSPLIGHTDCVTSVKFRRDGRFLFSTSWDKTIRIWDVNTGLQVGNSLTGHTHWVESVDINNNGDTIVSASSDNTIRLWSFRWKEQIGKPINNHTSSVYSVAFSPDGKYIASSSFDGTIRITNLNHLRKKEYSELRGHRGIARSIAFSPSGDYLISSEGSDNTNRNKDYTIRIWNINTMKQVGEPLSGHTSTINSVAFSRDGKYIVSASNDKTIRLWNFYNNRNSLRKPFVGHDSSVTSVVFSLSGDTIISASEDKTIRLWNAKTGEQIGKPLLGHSGVINSIAINKNGKIVASASNDGTIRLWDINTGSPIGTPLIGHSSYVKDVTFSPNGRYLASASLDNTIRIWDVCKCEQIGDVILAHINEVNSVSFSPDSRFIVSSGNCSVKVWDVDTRLQVVNEMQVDVGFFANCAQFSPKGNCIAAVRQSSILVWAFPLLQNLIDATRERFKNRLLTPEERRKYYLE